jgi:hypothetical protein
MAPTRPKIPSLPPFSKTWGLGGGGVQNVAQAS